MNDTHDRVKAAFRAWCLDQVAVEVENDLGRIKLIADPVPMYLVELVDGWEKDDKRMLLRAMVKRTPGQQWLDPSLSIEDRAILGRFEFPPMRSAVLWDAEARLARGDYKIDSTRLRRLVKGRLEGSLGTPVRLDSRAVRYVTHIQDMTMLTDVEFGGRSFQIRYSQSLALGHTDHRVSMIDDRLLLGNVSVSSYFGLSGDTSWCYLTNDDLPKVADNISKFCVELIASIPQIMAAASR